MSTKTREDILGFEYDWLAVDRDGHLGVFSTAGGGVAPPAFLADTDAHDAGLEALLQSSQMTSARFFPELAEGLDNTWRDAALRGVFAFDSDPNGSPYRLVAAPTRPVRLSEAPGLTSEAAGRVQLDHLSFESLQDGEVVEVVG